MIEHAVVQQGALHSACCLQPERDERNLQPKAALSSVIRPDS